MPRAYVRGVRRKRRHLEAFSLPWRDERGTVWLDNSATVCVKCYGETMETLPLGRMLRVGYKRRG